MLGVLAYTKMTPQWKCGNINPLGLKRVYRPGTKNGPIISWMMPTTKVEVFRWDANTAMPSGSHYHIYSSGHYYAGDIVPEPYASLYFPQK